MKTGSIQVDGKVSLRGQNLESNDVQAKIADHASVQSLDLANNYITELGPLDFLSNNLVRLNVSHNRLQSLGGGLKKLKSLTDLDISFNYLDSMKGIEFAPALRRLDCASNWITRLEGLELAKDLEELNLSDNLIQSVRNIRAISANSRLRSLHIARNPIAEKESEMIFVKQLVHADATVDSGRTDFKIAFVRQHIDHYDHHPGINSPSANVKIVVKPHRMTSRKKAPLKRRQHGGTAPSYLELSKIRPLAVSVSSSLIEEKPDVHFELSEEVKENLRRRSAEQKRKSRSLYAQSIEHADHGQKFWIQGLRQPLQRPHTPTRRRPAEKRPERKANNSPDMPLPDEELIKAVSRLMQQKRNSLARLQQNSGAEIHSTHAHINDN